MALSNYESVKRWRARNKDKVNAQAARRRAKYPEKFAESAKRYRERHGARLRPIEAENARKKRAADPDGNRRRMAAFKQRQLLKQEQIAGRSRPDVCELCGELHIRVVFDHCHKTGQFRGWLCDRCNKVLGLVYDNAALLRGLALYLEKHNECPESSPEKQAA